MLFVPIQFNAIPELRESGVTDQQIRDVLIKVASRFTPIIQKSAPVDTGALRRSLRVELLLDDSGVVVTSNVKYAGFVEYGTRKMRPRSYVERIVPDLIRYGNQLLSELGSFQVSAIKVLANTRDLDTGEGVSRVSIKSLSSIKPVGVQFRSVNQISVDPESIEPEFVV
jgi:hypothetical protein